ncbi:MAG: hypothetical protein PHV20_09335 [Bacteroidales bacterium]|nr:hypothetical protein [Bacteroidales bacterium]
MNAISKTQQNFFKLTLIPLSIAVNIGIGLIVKSLNLPIYLDSIGTIISTILFGWQIGLITGVLSFVFTTILSLNPFAIFFSGTQAAIAILIYILAHKGWFKKTYSTIFSGIIVGAIAAIVSMPVIYYLFGGATGNGASIIVAYFINKGLSPVNSIVISGFIVEPIDKTIQILIAIYVVKNLPTKLVTTISNNDLIKRLKSAK